MILKKTEIREVADRLRTRKTEKMKLFGLIEEQKVLTEAFVADVSSEILQRPALNTAQFKNIVQNVHDETLRTLFHCQGASDNELDECIASYNEAMLKSDYWEFLKDYDFFSKDGKIVLDTYALARERLHTGFRRFMAREHEEVKPEEVTHQISLFEKMLLSVSAAHFSAVGLGEIFAEYEKEAQHHKGNEGLY